MPCATNFGLQEWLLLALILVVLFGVKRLPEVGHGLGLGIRRFKKAIRDADDEDDDPKRPKNGKES